MRIIDLNGIAAMLPLASIWLFFGKRCIFDDCQDDHRAVRTKEKQKKAVIKHQIFAFPYHRYIKIILQLFTFDRFQC